MKDCCRNNLLPTKKIDLSKQPLVIEGRCKTCGKVWTFDDCKAQQSSFEGYAEQEGIKQYKVDCVKIEEGIC